MIVSSNRPVGVVGGGETCGNDLKQLNRFCFHYVGADSGAEVLLSNGITPDAVIGDFDSLDTDVKDRLDQNCIFHDTDQDSTDFEKAVRRINAPLIIGAGLLGARMDHSLAAFHVLCRYPHQKIILITSDDVITLLPPAIGLDVAPQTRVSLFPLGLCQATSTGLQWPVDGIAFDPVTKIGTSNHATEPVHLTANAPVMLVILPVSELDHLVEAVGQAPDWPVPAAQHKDQPPR